MMQRMKQGKKAGEDGGSSDRKEVMVAEDRVEWSGENKGNESKKKGLSGYGSLPLEIIVCVCVFEREGWWLFTTH